MPMSNIEIPNLTDSQKLYKGLVDNQLTINTAVNNLQEVQEKHHKLLIEGNGEIPLLERTRNLEAFVKEIRYWIKFIFGVIITWTVGQLILAIVAINWLYPILTKLASQP